MQLEEMIQRALDVHESANDLRKGLDMRYPAIVAGTKLVEQVLNQHNESVREDDKANIIDAVALGGIAVMMLVSVFLRASDEMYKDVDMGELDDALRSEAFNQAKTAFASVILSATYASVNKERADGN